MRTCHWSKIKFRYPNWTSLKRKQPDAFVEKEEKSNLSSIGSLWEALSEEVWPTKIRSRHSRKQYRSWRSRFLSSKSLGSCQHQPNMAWMSPKLNHFIANEFYICYFFFSIVCTKLVNGVTQSCLWFTTSGACIRYVPHCATCAEGRVGSVDTSFTCFESWRPCAFSYKFLLFDFNVRLILPHKFELIKLFNFD